MWPSFWRDYVVQDKDHISHFFRKQGEIINNPPLAESIILDSNKVGTTGHTDI